MVRIPVGKQKNYKEYKINVVPFLDENSSYLEHKASNFGQNKKKI